MATGTIVTVDPDSGRGTIRPDSRGEYVGFAADADVRPWWPGDRVSYTAEVTSAGVAASNLTRLDMGL